GAARARPGGASRAPRPTPPAAPGPCPRASESFELEAFEVAGLGDVQEHGVVAGLGEAMGDPDADAGVGGRPAADVLEERVRDVMGAREGQEAPARLEAPQRAPGDIL